MTAKAVLLPQRSRTAFYFFLIFFKALDSLPFGRYNV